MKRSKNYVIWGMPLMLSYLTKDMTFLGWEVSNIISMVLMLGFMYIMYMYSR